MVGELRGVHRRLAAVGDAAPSVPPAVVTAMRRSAPVARPLGVDLRLGGTLVLPDVVAREAETAAATLARLAPPGPTHVRDYHLAFIERYGTDALVRLTEVIDPASGLGLPAGYRDVSEPPPAPRRRGADRDARLLALAWHAVHDGVTEITLDRSVIDELTVVADHPIPPPAHLELGVRLHAPDHHAISRGDFRLVVFTVSRAVGTMTGRFLDLLDPDERARAIAGHSGLPATVAEALPLQVSCPPLYTTTHDIARSPAVLPDVLHLAEYPPPDGAPGTAPRRTPLSDLALYADRRRLHLVSMSRRHTLAPRVVNAVELTRRAHPLARLLCELESGQATAPTPLFWGAARHLPFLPRVRCGRTVLSPARWRLTTGELPGPDEPFARWADAVHVWRARSGVPDTVTVGDGDRQLRLALTDEDHLRLLRGDLRRQDVATLTEAPRAEDLAWLDGHLHEIVVPLARATPHPSAPPRLRGIAVTRQDHAHLPGHGRWLQFHIYAHPDRHDAILRGCLPNLLAGWAPAPDWWFLPYRDPDHHLRLRLAPAAEPRDVTWHAEALSRLGHWSADLRRRGLVGRTRFDTYLPEIGRFGDGALLDAAEAVFMTDSAYVLHRLPPAMGDRDASVAAGLVDLAVSFLDDPTTGSHWLVDRLSRDATAPLSRASLRTAVALARPGLARDTAAPEDLVTRERYRALTVYAARRRAAGLDVGAVLPTLLHLHCVRALGLDRDTERTCHRLARAVALGHLVRIGAAR